MGRDKTSNTAPTVGSHAKERHRKAAKPTLADWQAPLPPGLVAKKDIPRPKSKHHSYFEFVENKEKKKKLELEVTLERTPPPGFEFVPIGNPKLTSRCKEISREQDAMVFIVSLPNTLNKDLILEVNRVGHHVRQSIVEQARAELGQLDEAGNALPIGQPEPIPETQDEINAQADAAIRDLFPRVPNTDRQLIIEHAFKKGAKLAKGEPLVGLAPDLPLSRRVQLAVLAHIRHTHTRYDELLRETSWVNARKAVESLCLDILVKWRGDDETGRDQLDEILREVVIISDSESDDDDDDSDEDMDTDEESSDEDVTMEGASPTPAPLPAGLVRGYAPHMEERAHARDLDANATAEHSPMPRHANRTRKINRKLHPQRGFHRYEAAREQIDQVWDEAVERQRREAYASPPAAAVPMKRTGSHLSQPPQRAPEYSSHPSPRPRGNASPKGRPYDQRAHGVGGFDPPLASHNRDAYALNGDAAFVRAPQSHYAAAHHHLQSGDAPRPPPGQYPGRGDPLTAGAYPVVSNHDGKLRDFAVQSIEPASPTAAVPPSRYQGAPRPFQGHLDPGPAPHAPQGGPLPARRFVVLDEEDRRRPLTHMREERIPSPADISMDRPFPVPIYERDSAQAARAGELRPVFTIPDHSQAHGYEGQIRHSLPARFAQPYSGNRLSPRQEGNPIVVEDHPYERMNAPGHSNVVYHEVPGRNASPGFIEIRRPVAAPPSSAHQRGFQLDHDSMQVARDDRAIGEAEFFPVHNVFPRPHNPQTATYYRDEPALRPASPRFPHSTSQDHYLHQSRYDHPRHELEPVAYRGVSDSFPARRVANERVVAYEVIERPNPTHVYQEMPYDERDRIIHQRPPPAPGPFLDEEYRQAPGPPRSRRDDVIYME